MKYRYLYAVLVILMAPSAFAANWIKKSVLSTNIATGFSTWKVVWHGESPPYDAANLEKGVSNQGPWSSYPDPNTIWLYNQSVDGWVGPVQTNRYYRITFVDSGVIFDSTLEKQVFVPPEICTPNIPPRVDP